MLNVWDTLQAAGMNPASLSERERIEVFDRLYGEDARRPAAHPSYAPVTQGRPIPATLGEAQNV